MESIPKTKVLRQPHLVVEDAAVLKAILRAAAFCNVAITEGVYPVIIPMAFVIDERDLFLHGSTQSRLMKALAAGTPACVSVTLYDGLVLAKSAYNHTMNYRSVSVFGTASEISNREEKISILKTLSDKYVPGRWETVRFPTEEELNSMMLLRIPLAKISGKVRSGPPDDFEKDLHHPVWSGTIPFKLIPENPEPDPKSLTPLPIPQNVLEIIKKARE